MIQLSDLSLEVIKDALNKSKAKQLSDYFNQPVFRASDTGITYRKINELDNFNLATNQRQANNGWRRFSSNDVVKLQIADRLGSFGFTKSKDIKDVIEFIEQHNVEVNDKNGKTLYSLSILDCASFLAVADIATFLLVNKNDVVAFVDGKYYSEHIQEIASNDILTISLSTIIYKLDEKFKKIVDTKGGKLTEYTDLPVTPEELSLLKLIRSGDYSKVELKFGPGGVFDMVQATNTTTIEKGQRSPAQLIKLVQNHSGNFAEVSLIKEDGQVVALRQTDRHKVKTHKKKLLKS